MPGPRKTNWSWVESQREERFSEEQRGSSRLIHREREFLHHQRVAPEPAPDYSPPSPRVTPSPSPPPQPQDVKKKVFQRTRFAADIPPVRKAAQSTQTPPQKSSIGQSFRKFVGKFRSASKEKRRGKKGSRSPSPQGTNTYQGYPLAGGGSEESDDLPVAPPRSARHRHSEASTQTMRRAGDAVVHKYYLGEDPFGGSIYGREKEYDGVTPFRRKHRRPSDDLEEERNARNHQLSSNGTSTSTLGRFSKSTSRLISERHNQVSGDRGGVQTLPRKLHDEHKAKKQVYQTKSNVERVSSSPQSWESQHYTKMNGNYPNSHSMINVSIVNKTTPPSSALGPAKPARTYRSSLLRSKSFNVHAGDSGPDFNSVHKSNPQLHRLDESPPPLKSPGIVTSISRSTKDISQEIEDEDNYRRAFNFNDQPFTKSTGHLNGYTNSRTIHDTKKKIFMKNLQDRAPELFRTLHGNDVDETRKMSPDIDDRGRMFTSTPLKNGHRVVEYSNSFRSSNTSSPLINGSDRVHSPSSPSYTTSITHTPSFRNGGEVVNRSVVRRGSNDDYSETVRITSKSDDPLRPSVTNTVQSFSKKILPVKGGRGKETIESSETKTITKSRYRGGDRDLKYIEGTKYAPRNGGVVIEVRNNPK